MEYVSCAEVAAKWGISERRVQKLCEGERIPGAVKFSRIWLIPKDAEKPVDGRRIDSRAAREPCGGETPLELRQQPSVLLFSLL